MILYGASGHARVILDILHANDVNVTESFDDNEQITTLQGVKVVTPHVTDEPVIVSIGNNRIRKRIAENNPYRYGVAIHPTAIVSPSAIIGEGTVVMQGAIIQAGAVIGRHCIINTGASVDHECRIEDYVHVSPHATLCGDVAVREGAWIGAGSVVIQGITIGTWSTVGAGSTVIRDVDPEVTVVWVHG